MRIPRWVFAITLAAICVPAWTQEGRDLGLKLVEEALRSLDAGRAVDAYRSLQQAREIAESEQADDLRGAVLVGLGEFETARSRFDAAKNRYKQALPHLEKTADGDRLARALNGLARLEIFGTRYPAAENYLSRVDSLKDVHGETQSTNLRLRSELQARIGNLAAAQELSRQAIAHAGQRDSIGYGRAMAQQARLAVRASAYREGFERWQAALEQFRRLGAIFDMADALASLADLYFQFGLVEESKSKYEVALEQFMKIGNRTGEGRTLVRLARVERRLRRPDLAIAHAERALKDARKYHDYVTEAETLLELGEIWVGDPVPEMVSLPNRNVAQRYLRAAREIYKDAGDRGAGAAVWLRSGAIYLRAERFTTALRSFELVAKTARELGNEDLLWQALRGEALALAGSDDLAAAAARFEEAIDTLERIYAQTAGLSEEARSSFLGDRRGIYEEYVEVLIRLRKKGGDPDQDRHAFALSERAKSRQFTEMLAQGGAERAVASADPRLRDLVSQERAIRANLGQLISAMAAPGAQESEAAGIDARMAALRKQHGAVLREIEGDFPKYAELLHPKAVSVADVQAILQPNETLVSYFVGARVTAAFVLTRQEFHLIPIEVPRSKLRALVDRFRRPFTNIANFDELIDWDARDALALYQQLVGPIIDRVPPRSTLVIAGDDCLYTLPFEALLRDPPQAERARAPLFAEMVNFKWFGDEHPTTYVPSAGAFRALRAEDHAHSWRTAVVAFADPDFGGTGVSAARGITRLAGDAPLARLPETADEVRTVAAVLKGESAIFLQREATESRAKSIDLSGVRYLLFSTHGLLGGEISAIAEPALALTLVGNPPGDDGFLSMSEVLGLRLGADVAVLSACNTAGKPGAARVGEGFAGLTRSFMYAGARSLVVSHWPVGSQATVALMTAFFHALSNGEKKPVALAQARRQLRSSEHGGIQLAHPYFWAPFVIVGETR